jgi:transcriptional regulator with XRE-family HTH domain
MAGRPTIPATPRLRQIRERRFISAGELAKRSGVAKSTILRLENRGGTAHLRTIRQLARALGVAPASLTETAGPKTIRLSPAPEGGSESGLQADPTMEASPRPSPHADFYRAQLARLRRLTPDEIGDALAVMDADPDRAAEMARLDAELDRASWEAFRDAVVEGRRTDTAPSGERGV